MQKLSTEQEMDIMREWFYKNYEDPVEHCPYESAEGGYQFIYGGPFDAEDELRVRFEGRHSEEALLQLIEELKDIGYEWSGIPQTN